ncbi:MAG: hypothetical protein H0T42_25060 [Deltaproteobacteria bacterium]|nr:hypothetical protein [Deltaproteobacteria bacterium]
MKNFGVELPWSRGLSLGAAGVIAIALGLLRCETPRTTSPAIVAVGQTLLAAWEQRSDEYGMTVYVRRISPVDDGITTLRGGVPIYRNKYASTGYHTPELATGPAGSIVIVTPSPGDQVAIPIDRDGRAAGPAQPLTGCRGDSSDRACFWTCRRPVARGDGFVVGHVSAYPRSTVKSLDLSFLDRLGRTERFLVLPSEEPLGCAMAASGDDLVVVSTEQRINGDYAVHVQFVTLADGSPVTDFWISGRGARTVIATATGHFALLHLGPDGELRISRFSRYGVESTRPIPGPVELATADLGITSRGPFVSWIENRRLHVRDLTSERDVGAKRVSANAVGTRAVGIGERCVAAWTSGAGSKLHLLGVADCP